MTEPTQEEDDKLIKESVCLCDACCEMRRNISMAAVGRLDEGSTASMIASCLATSVGTFMGNMLEPDSFEEALAELNKITLAVARHTGRLLAELENDPEATGATIQ